MNQATTVTLGPRELLVIGVRAYELQREFPDLTPEVVVNRVLADIFKDFVGRQCVCCGERLFPRIAVTFEPYPHPHLVPSPDSELVDQPPVEEPVR